MKNIEGLKAIMSALNDDSLPNNVRFIKIIKEVQKLKKGGFDDKPT